MRDIIRKPATVSKVSIDHDDNKLIEIKLENGSKEALIITPLVRVYDNSQFEIIDPAAMEIGREVFVYHRENTPMMMSMPPKYVPELVIVNNNEDDIEHKFMFFDEDLISADNQIKISDDFLRIVESIEYRPLIKELLVNQELLVFYKEVTKSVPAIVFPKKVIIL